MAKTTKKITKKDIDYVQKVQKEALSRQERIEVLAERVGVLIGFCSMLIPDIDLIEETSKHSENNVSMVMSAAPIIMAMGMDWEQKEFEAKLHSRRAHALHNLIKVLKETEDERIEFKNKQEKKKAGADELRKILGL